MLRSLARTQRHSPRCLAVPTPRTCRRGISDVQEPEKPVKLYWSTKGKKQKQVKKAQSAQPQGDNNLGVSFDRLDLSSVPAGVSLGRRLLEVDIDTIKPSHGNHLDESASKPKVKWNYVQLRDACTCAACVDPHSNNRKFRTVDIPENIQPSSVRHIGDSLEIQWENDIASYGKAHTSVYNTDILQLGRPGNKLPYSMYTEKFMWDRKAMEERQYWITYEDYMNNEVEFARAMRNIQYYGLIFIKNVPDSREMVEKLATRIAPVQNTFYGATWDVRQKPQAENVAYTNEFLGFHMDLLYMFDVPKLQLLHCLKNSCDGGESLFVDGYGTATTLMRSDPKAFSSLSSFKVPYHCVTDNEIYYQIRPVINVGKRDSSIRAINYSPPFQAPWGPLGSQHSYDAFVEFHDALKKFVREMEKESTHFELKMQPGTCVVFDNRRILHARRAFDTSSGERWLAGTYLSAADVRSRMKVAYRDHPEAFAE